MTLIRTIAACFFLALLTIQVGAAQHFVERGLEAGLGDAIHSNGVAVADYDMDGDLDIYVVSVTWHDGNDPNTWNRLYSNNGDGTFTEVTDQAGVRSAHVSGLGFMAMGNRFTAAWADYDGDTDPDLLLTKVGAEVLFQNNGDGTFTDVSLASGINRATPSADTTETTGAAWWDYDLDGDLDVYLSDWNGPNRMYANQGDGTFQPVAAALAVDDTARTWMALPLDFDRDGWRDLYLANDFGPNRLYMADGAGGFTDETFAYRMGDEGNGMGIALGDINGDLLSDIYVTNIASTPWPNVMYVANPALPYEEVAAFLGVHDADWAWGTELFDFDHDGDLDLYAVNGFLFEDNTPNRFWRNDLVPHGTVSFVDQTERSGAGDTAEARALVTFDYDGDGDLDMLVGTWSDRLRLFENQAASGNWIQLDLRAAGAMNRYAVGAEIEVLAGGRRQIRVNDGIDFLGQSIQPLHLGLGTAGFVEELSVLWPSGVRERFYNLPVNQLVTLSEGTGSVSIEHEGPSRLSLTPYPNPATDQLLGLRGSDPVRVYDVLGRVVLTADDAQERLDVSALSPGLYLIQIGQNRATFQKR